MNIAQFGLLLSLIPISTAPPWKENTPIVSVQRELYEKCPRPGVGIHIWTYAAGPKLELMQIRGLEMREGGVDDISARFSDDNGRTWTQPSNQPPTTRSERGVDFWESALGNEVRYDPAAKVLIVSWLRQISRNDHYDYHTYYQLSRDHGRSWTKPRMLKYEEGDDFDPKSPLQPNFLKRNRSYCGNNILCHSNGTLIHPVGHVNAPSDPKNETRAFRMGSLCFIGKWDAGAGDHRWTAGKRVETTPRISEMGLAEPEAAELRDGRVFVVWRGMNTAETPGRKWFSVSSDGGQTLTPVAEWKYDDGSRFYSPSSFHRMIRHSVTKKLYWIGNICSDPPKRHYPRYPLVIAEVEESIPALKRETVTVIDDRREGQGPEIFLSNFSVYEDAESHAIVLYMSDIGSNPKSFFDANCFRYTIALLR